MDNFSIVIPIFNEEDNIIDLLQEIEKYLDIFIKKFEVIIIDDCSNDNTFEKLKNFKNKLSIRVFKNDKNYGQSFSIRKGVIESKYDTIVTLDGDGQNHPKDIRNLLSIYYSDKNISLVSGIRINRKDNHLKKISSKLANLVRSFILKDGCLDTGCSLKVFNKNMFLKIPYFNGLHRFIPAFFKAFKANVHYENVSHRPRLKGKSNYGTIDRLYRGIIDMYKVINLINKKND